MNAIASEPARPAFSFSWKHPAVVTLLAMILLVAAVVGSAGGDPLSLARLGTRFSEGNPAGTEGYDGQFVYYIARSPAPAAVAQFLDVPAYRYQRILLPLLARWLSLGNLQALPWVLAVLGILFQAAGTWLVAELLAGYKVSRWYALVYGLWAGFALAVRLDLPETLAYAFIAAALLAQQREKRLLSWPLYALALFSKEVTLVFVGAQLLSDLSQRRWKDVIGLGLIALAPFALFQIWLWQVFGQLGIGSGGAMATSFEWIPYMGLLRIAGFSFVYFLAMLVVFGPSVVLPSLWGLWKSINFWRAGQRNVIVLGLLLNALVVAFMPFSTFRETGGLMRYACGLVLAVLLFAAKYRMQRALNYSLFWIVLNVFLLKS